MAPPAPASLFANLPLGEFLLCGCQQGAEGSLRERFAAAVPGSRPAAWRKGVATFRLPAAEASDTGGLPSGEILDQLVFARTLIHSLGQVTGGDSATLAAGVSGLAGGHPWQRVHCWSRQFVPGPLQPSLAEAVAAARHAVATACGLPAETDSRARPGERVLDVVLDTPDRWWVGWHRADGPASWWPGGIYPSTLDPLPAGKVSRAWLKLDEAIAVFGIPFVPGQRAVELGAAPGGACQRLLEAGLEVVGVDPALVDPVVAACPGFTQWRLRARDVPLKRFAGIDWLVADMNIDPTSTLAALGRVASGRGVRLAGIVATLKLPTWSRAAELPGWLDTLRNQGFTPRARQLSSSGREICVVALPTAGRATWPGDTREPGGAGLQPCRR
jgi:23S rRNA (cytidine2498-2'-O)-methyltransferase